MSSLEVLPPALIARILGFRDCQHLVIPLWLCGSKRLNNRLKLGGCKSFRTPSWVTRAKKWPRLLSALHGLRSVSFCVEKIDEDLNTIVLHILTLRPTALRSLQITMPGASYITTVEDPILSVQVGHPVRIDLGARFPNLKELRMTDSGVNPVDTFFVWPNLPMSLRTLEWSVVVYSSKSVNRDRLQTGNIFPIFLPPRLTTLKFNTGPGAMKVRDVGFLMLALPRTLTHLEGIYVKEPKFVALLPRTLKNCDFLRDIRSYTPELALCLPPDLEAVYCSRMGRRGSLRVDSASWNAIGKDYEKSLPGLLILVMEFRSENGEPECNPAFVAFKKIPNSKPQVLGRSFVL